MGHSDWPGLVTRPPLDLSWVQLRPIPRTISEGPAVLVLKGRFYYSGMVRPGVQEMTAIEEMVLYWEQGKQA